MPQPSQGPRPEDLHVTPRGWATKSKQIANSFKEWLEGYGVSATIEESNGWLTVRLTDPEAERLLPPFAEKEFARKHRIRLWLLYMKLYDPDNDFFGGGTATVGDSAARSGVVASEA